jgi:hypothetical protein
VFCFSCDAAPGRPAATLWLQPRGPEEWRVSNVVGLGRHTLTDEEYTHILAEFKDQFLQPQSTGGTMHAEVRPVRPRLEDYLSPEAARLLRAFSATTNRTALLPADRQHWQQFLLCAHREQTPMEGAFLEEWLASEGWPEASRAELGRDYESTRQLLWSYDEEQRR